MARGYLDLQGSVRHCLARGPRPVEIYGWMVLASLVVFVSRLPLVARGLPTDAPLPIQDGGAFLAAALILLAVVFATLLGPLAASVAALPVHVALRHVFRGRGGWRATFAATAWAMLLTAPLWLVEGFARLLVEFARPVYREMAGQALSATLLLASVWVWSRCQSVAHGYRRHWWLFGGCLALAAALLLLSAALAEARPVR